MRRAKRKLCVRPFPLERQLINCVRLLFGLVIARGCVRGWLVRKDQATASREECDVHRYAASQCRKLEGERFKERIRAARLNCFIPIQVS